MDFQSEKSFGKLRHRAFQTNSNQILCVKACQRRQRLFWPLTPSTCFNIHTLWWYGWKALSLSFSKLFQIENPLVLRKLLAKTCVCSFGTFDIHSIKSYIYWSMSKMSKITPCNTVGKVHMLKMSKMWNAMNNWWKAMYVKGVERRSKYTFCTQYLWHLWHCVYELQCRF